MILTAFPGRCTFFRTEMFQDEFIKNLCLILFVGKFRMIVIISQLRCFLTFAGQSFNILIVLRASRLKATSSEA